MGEDSDEMEEALDDLQDPEALEEAILEGDEDSDDLEDDDMPMYI